MQLNAETPNKFMPTYWLRGRVGDIATWLCGLIAVLVAIKAAAVQPNDSTLFSENGQFVRVLAFGALTVWTALAIGLQRRGAAAIITLAFAVFVEVFLVNVRSVGMPAIVSANLGIVLAYCGLQLYSFALARRQNEPEL
ncbi:MAG: hypothetical protein AAFO74_04085 [Pseudomonadota bacterium]